MRIIITLTFVWIHLTIFAQSNDIVYYINQAKNNSPLIYEKNIRNAALDVEIKQIKAFYTKPQVALNAGLLFAPIVSADNNKTKFEFVSSGADDYYGYDLAVSDGGQYQAVVSVEQPVFNGKRLDIASQNIAVTKQINETEIKLTIHDIERIVGYQYLRCLRSQERAEAYTKLTGLVNNELKLMKQLTQSGIYKYSDFELLKIELQNYRVLLEKTKAEFSQNLSELNIICGINDTTDVELESLAFSLKTPVEQSYFLKKYELDSLKLNAIQQLSEIKYKPQLSLFADGGLNATYLPGYNRLGLGFGLKFSWTLFDGHQRDLTRDRTNILKKDFIFKRNRFITENSVRKTNILNQIKSIDKQLKIKSVQDKSYDNLMKIYKTEFSQGELSAVEFVSVLRDKVNLNLEIIDLKMQKQALINTYNYWNY